MNTPRQLLLNGKVYDCRAEETVLDALLRQHVDVPYSCRQQVCMSCIMRCLNGSPPSASQINMKQTLRVQNNFLACGCYPERDMEIALPKELVVHQVSAEVMELNRLNSVVLELVLQSAATTPISATSPAWNKIQRLTVVSLARSRPPQRRGCLGSPIGRSISAVPVNVFIKCNGRPI